MNVPTHLSELSFCTYWSVMKAGEIFNQDLFYQLGFCDDQRWLAGEGWHGEKLAVFLIIIIKLQMNLTLVSDWIEQIAYKRQRFRAWQTRELCFQHSPLVSSPIVQKDQNSTANKQAEPLIRENSWHILYEIHNDDEYVDSLLLLLWADAFCLLRCAVTLYLYRTDIADYCNSYIRLRTILGCFVIAINVNVKYNYVASNAWRFHDIL